MPGTKLASIQVLRCAAILMVFAYHAPLLVAGGPLAAVRDSVPDSLYFGYAGVDLFFVISGFIIMLVTDRQRASVGEFLLRRVFRIIPLYWAFTLLLILASLLKPEAVPIRGDSYGSFLVNSFLLIPMPVRPLLGVGWSLQHEFIFYLTAVALMLMAARKYLAAVLFGMFCAGVALHVLLYRTNGAVVWDWKILSLYNFEFMLGVLAYQFRPPGGAMVSALLIVGGLALFVATSTVCAGLLPPSREVPVFALDMLGLWRVLGFGGASFLTLAGLVSLERTGMFDRIGAAGAQGLAAAASVGDASYSIYLIHNLFLTAAGRVLARHVDSVQVFLLVAAVAAVVVCGVGIIFHRLVERPLVRICERDLVPWLLGATRREARA